MSDAVSHSYLLDIWASLNAQANAIIAKFTSAVNGTVDRIAGHFGSLEQALSSQVAYLKQFMGALPRFAVWSVVSTMAGCATWALQTIGPMLPTAPDLPTVSENEFWRWFCYFCPLGQAYAFLTFFLSCMVVWATVGAILRLVKVLR